MLLKTFSARYVAASSAARWEPLALLLIGLVAALPRVIDLGGFVTVDEANFWLQRSERFLQALQSGDYYTMPITGHPGVATMWLGSAGVLLRHVLDALGLSPGDSFAHMLALMRLPVALVHVFAILVGFRLLRILLPVPAALVAALLWALDPFVVGYSRVLHVDALAGTFITLSILAACSYWNHLRQPWLLALSGVCAGLALLTKSPALALLPVVGLVALTAPTSEAGVAAPVGRRLAPLAAWLAICCATAIVFWPALWGNPAGAIAGLISGVEDEGAQPHMLGNFFLGQPDPAPGVLYYPVALALRLTPWAMLGLALLPLALRSRRLVREPRDLAVLAGLVVLFVVAMSMFPKKFDRYLVPIVPLLDLLAAVGLAWGALQVERLMTRLGDAASGHAAGGAALGMLLFTAMVSVAHWHPYGLLYANPLLGGAPVAARTFQTGWGEGLEQVAAWLNAQPDITGVITASTQRPSLQPYMRPGAQVVSPADSLPERTGYVVVYLRHAQGDVLPPHYFERLTPVHVVRIHGVEVAWIYEVPPEAPELRPAVFGSHLYLRGYERISPSEPDHQALLNLHLFWYVLEPAREDVWIFAHLVDQQGNRVAQVDLPLPTSSWLAGRHYTTELVLPAVHNVPAGRYRLQIGLYDPATQQRLPLQSLSAADLAQRATDALVLTTVQVVE